MQKRACDLGRASGSERTRSLEPLQEKTCLQSCPEETAPVINSFPPSLLASSVTKGPVATNSDTEGSQPAGRKRRWGASTATTQKKPSISITTESLKSLIPEIKPPLGGQEAVVDLHADDSRISEDEAERHLEEPAHEKALKICRTVTQVVPVEGQENGQGEEEEEEEEK
ncbi:PREDICTED: apoptotic chromatin condensation inducer in the nucleus-like, partial [Thamnophis sirtalis]|uniref:Apoptotic chromatin condensation inducer in the nucleus-like n=1 Tax=Thamnophis sirtalis TaxID=35019 RepID=A0A6I9XVY4_9SAUR